MPERPVRTAADAPYARIAAFYDALMAHVDYELWADYLRDIWRRHSEGPLASVYDAACGTGRLLERLCEPGLRRAGSDLSEGMLAIARRRLGERAALSRQDLRAVSETGSWDLVSCLYDSVNYLLESGELEAALRRLAALTGAGGLLVFDVCTERNSLDHFLDYVDTGVVDRWEYERHSWYDPERRLHHNDFLVIDLASGERWRENHLQRIYRVADVEASIQRAGLERLATYAEFSFRRGSESADRVHFVARKPGARR